MPSDEQLSGVLREFARTLVTDFPIQGILDHLVKRIVDVLPITAAGVTLISPGADPRYVAASDDSALRFEELQTELGEGPCLEAYLTGIAVAVPDLRRDTRFPTFTPRALEAGLVAVFTFPLWSGSDRLGALDLYRNTPGSLDASTMDAAQTLADVAAAYLLNAQARADLRDSSNRSRETALHDALTGLPNRILFLERLDHAVLRSRRSGRTAAVLFADIDRFKVVNDMFGHHVGDELLVAVAERLCAVLRPGDTLARMSGDEFVVLCEDLGERGQADVIASRICAAVALPFSLSSGSVDVTASVGIAFAGSGDGVAEHLLKDADTAMYQAKRSGGARHQVIDLRAQHLAAHGASLERDLQGAGGRGEFRNQYQPIVDTADGRIIGVEALLRWEHPAHGAVMPALLVPLAEKCGLITEIGRGVLQRACADCRGWRRNTGDLGMSVNVSAHQLMSADYAADVGRVLAEADMDPTLVTLEVTESVFVQDSDRALVVLNDLKGVGVALALDDFGTGYSSLNYLKSFPIDVVKIDRGFVADLGQDRASDAIVYTVVELAHMLGMTVVAEGVETGQQHRLLAALGCDACQGNYFALPMSVHDLGVLMHEGSAGGAVHLPAFAAAANA
jgi:diguanylate cyclase (GGDEF)-like protein